MTTVGELGERGLLCALARRLPGGAGVALGVGDDAALLEALGPLAALSTDLLVEGVDFELAWASPRDIGHKAAAVNLSDLAAMGARPRACLLSLGLRAHDRVADVLALVDALHRYASRFGAPLVGGDLSRTSGPLFLSVTVVGEVARSSAIMRRRGRPGDVVMVSGTLGAAAAGLRLVEASRRAPASLLRRLLRPTPRVALGLALAASGVVQSGADVSDGLASDALHVAGPGCGVELDSRRLPVARGVAEVAAWARASWLALALDGGEDFELVVAVPPKKVVAARAAARAAGVRLTAVGVVSAAPGLRVDGAPYAGQGFDHWGERAARPRGAPGV